MIHFFAGYDLVKNSSFQNPLTVQQITLLEICHPNISVRSPVRENSFHSNSKSSLLGFFVRLLSIVQLGKIPGCVDSGADFERSASQNMWSRLKFEQTTWTQLFLDKNTCTRLVFRSKHMESIKLSVFIPPQSDFCISTASFYLPSQI